MDLRALEEVTEREGAQGPGALPLLGLRVGHLRFLLFSLYWLTET